MSDPKKTNLLIPLGIGAALLLLLTKKGKAADAGNSMVAADNNTSTVPQITPEPAPQYNLPATKAGGGEEETDDTETDDEGSGQQQEEGGQEETDSEDDHDTAYRSSGGGGDSPNTYRPGATINTNSQQTSRQTYVPPASSGQPYINPKSLRFQSDQARKFAERQKLRNNSLYIGNGKPRMGVQLPVTYRPGATSASQQPIVITPNSTSNIKPAVLPQKAGAIFPLKFGQRNSYIKELQKKIGVSATGYFGTQTRAMLQKRFGASEVSEVLYKQVTAAKTATPLPIKRTVARPVKKYRPVVRKKIVKRKK